MNFTPSLLVMLMLLKHKDERWEINEQLPHTGI